MTRRKTCMDFFSSDPRFSYERDGCGPCINSRKPSPLNPFGVTTNLYKCRKNHTVRIYHFREEALQEPDKKEKQFIVGIKLPRGTSRKQVMESIEEALESEVLILMEGQGTLGAGFLDSEFFGFDEVEGMGFTSPQEPLPPPEPLQEEEDPNSTDSKQTSPEK